MILTLLPVIAPKEAANVQAATIQGPRTDSDGNVTYDCVWFGRYPQSDSTGKTKEPIKWRVLSVDGDKAFLVADKNLDVQRYNDTNVDVTWENCTMRSWLNGYGSSSNICGKDYSSNNFIDRAFTAKQQSAIQITNLENADNPIIEIDGGNDTQDKIFLLSYDEVTNPSYGFKAECSLVGYGNDAARLRQNTAYVEAGGTLGTEGMYSVDSNDWWWLRSPGTHSGRTMRVDTEGYVIMNGYYVDCSRYAVVPALYLNLSYSDLYSYAGTVSTNGEVNVVPPVLNTQTITAKDITKTYGANAFSLGAKTNGDGKLTYKSSNTKVASIDTNGKVTIKGCGKTKITIIASKTEEYDAASKTITITVNPKKEKITSIKSTRAKTLTVKWKKDTKATGYRIQYSTDKKFKKNVKNVWVKKNTITSKTITRLRAGKKYYVRVAAVHKTGNQKFIGANSAVKSIRIKK
ncbi:MAG: DUF6273 domain-containing protein, partial [Coprococcus sp.]